MKSWLIQNRIGHFQLEPVAETGRIRWFCSIQHDPVRRDVTLNRRVHHDVKIKMIFIGILQYLLHVLGEPEEIGACLRVISAPKIGDSFVVINKVTDPADAVLPDHGKCWRR